MRKLNDATLLAQCVRIKSMMERVANDPKYQDDYYAEEYHHWQVSPPAHLYEIEEFERQTNVELPIEYVYYLTQVGRGGAAPGTYFEDFYANRSSDHYSRIASQFSSAENRMLSSDDWKQRFSNAFGNIKDYYDGTLSLCAMDLTYVAHLIVSGPLHGRVVYLDYNRDLPPIWPKGSPKFLESIQQPEYQKAISEVLQYFTQKSVKSEE